MCGPFDVVVEDGRYLRLDMYELQAGVVGLLRL